jgi:hypothetical protein
MIDELRLAIGNGQNWDRVAAPWRSVGSLGALRLSNGATLVRSFDSHDEDSRAIFWISPTGRVVRLDLQLFATEPPPGTICFRVMRVSACKCWIYSTASVRRSRAMG